MPVGDSQIFICFSSKDEAVAREVVDFLESAGLKCWISLRDVLPGQNYQEAIVRAIEAAGAIVFLFSESSNKSGEIKKELSIGASLNVPVFPVRLTPIAPSGALRYELAIRQWIDIFPHRRRALGKLSDAIRSSGEAAAQSADAPLDPSPSTIPAAAASATAGLRARSRPASGTRRAPRPALVASGSRQFEAIRALLARHIGPIAKVFVEKAANEARTSDEFCEQLAAHVPAASERGAFVRAVREQLATS